MYRTKLALVILLLELKIWRLALLPQLTKLNNPHSPISVVGWKMYKGDGDQIRSKFFFSLEQCKKHLKKTKIYPPKKKKKKNNSPYLPNCQTVFFKFKCILISKNLFFLPILHSLSKHL